MSEKPEVPLNCFFAEATTPFMKRRSKKPKTNVINIISCLRMTGKRRIKYSRNCWAAWEVVLQ